MAISDELLVIQYLAGDEKSLEVLIGRYSMPIYVFVYRYIGSPADAEDVAQDIFVKVWRSLKKFDRQRSFKTWIFSIAKNAAIDFLKKKKTVPFAQFENDMGRNPVLEKLADPALLPSKILEQADIASILEKAVDKISPRYKMVLFMRYNDHFNFREISEVLGEPIHTVKSRHRRALILLREILEKYI